MAQTNTAQTISFPEREVFGIPTADHHRLQPLLFLPDQFFTAAQQTTAMRSGERRLMFAVLQDAVARWFRYRHARTDSGREAFREIRDWCAIAHRPFARDRTTAAADVGSAHDHRRIVGCVEHELDEVLWRALG